MFLKSDSLGFIPRRVFRMGDRRYVDALQWLAYIGRRRHNVTHADNGREVHLPGVPNMKVDRYFAEAKVFDYLGYFGIRVLVYPIDASPLATLVKNC
jgi:hypothetical protein